MQVIGLEAAFCLNALYLDMVEVAGSNPAVPTTYSRSARLHVTRVLRKSPTTMAGSWRPELGAAGGAPAL